MDKKKCGLGSMKNKKSYASKEKIMDSEKPKPKMIQKLSSMAKTYKKVKGTDKY